MKTLMIDELTLYASMYRIRRFEETVLEEFKRGVFSGTTHTYIGQEADAVGVIPSLSAQDVIVTNHRCHGHFLAYGGDMRALFAELMGKATGVCGGRGGSQHLHWRNLFSNGIQGGIVPIASGMAMAEKRSGSGAVVTVFIGDGTLGEGIVYESLNMASLWNLPLMIVVENNHIAQTTPTATVLAGSMRARFESFGITVSELESSDVTEIQPLARQCIESVRNTQHPQTLILNTCRFGPHSKSDDTRPAEDLIRMKSERDPLRISRTRLDENLLADLEQKINADVRQAFEQALADSFPQTEGLA